MLGTLAAAAAAGALAASHPEPLEVRLAPADFLVLNPTNPARGYGDVVLHAAGVRAGGRETCRLEEMKVELLEKGRVRLAERLPPEKLVADTADLARQPVDAARDGQLLTHGGASGLFGAPTTLATGAAIAARQALFATRLHYSVGFAPDRVRVTAACSGGWRVSAEAAVKPYRSPIAYKFPLDGVWLMQAGPSIESHHRLNASTEFAADFFKLDAEGRDHTGDRMEAANYFGWGQPVRAAADGDVVRVIAGEVQDRHAFAPRPGETPAQAGERIEAMMLARLKADFGAANAGNLVVIRHQAGGVSEYSAYGHLKPGSVVVKVGDHVAQGQKIGEVGDTGDSPAVHLHFQINAGPDPFTDRSLPVAFSDLRALTGGEPGRLVAARQP